MLGYGSSRDVSGSPYVGLVLCITVRRRRWEEVEVETNPLNIRKHAITRSSLRMCRPEGSCTENETSELSEPWTVRRLQQ